MDNSILPLDLLEEIIHALAMQEETFDPAQQTPAPKRTGTQACSLVCKALLHMSRKHIFSDIRINGEEGALRFRKLLDSDPAIANLVLRLTVDTDSLPYLIHLVPNGTATYPRLDSLFFFYRTWGYSFFRWKCNLVETTLIRSPLLSRITFLGFGTFPLKYISHVKHLFFGELRLCTSKKPYSKGALFDALETLSVSFVSGGIFQALEDHHNGVREIIMNSPNLRMLSVEIGAFGVLGLFDLIRPVLPTLKQLNLVIDTSKDNDETFDESRPYTARLECFQHELRSFSSAETRITNPTTTLNLTLRVDRYPSDDQALRENFRNLETLLMETWPVLWTKHILIESVDEETDRAWRPLFLELKSRMS